MASQGGDLCSGLGIPQTRRAVPRRGRHPPAIGAERRTPYRVLMASQHSHLCSRLAVPQTRRAVGRRGRHLPAIGAERRTLYQVLMASGSRSCGGRDLLREAHRNAAISRAIAAMTNGRFLPAAEKWVGKRKPASLGRGSQVSADHCQEPLLPISSKIFNIPRRGLPPPRFQQAAGHPL